MVVEPRSTAPGGTPTLLACLRSKLCSVPCHLAGVQVGEAAWQGCSLQETRILDESQGLEQGEWGSVTGGFREQGRGPVIGTGVQGHLLSCCSEHPWNKAELVLLWSQGLS